MTRIFTAELNEDDLLKKLQVLYKALAKHVLGKCFKNELKKEEGCSIANYLKNDSAFNEDIIPCLHDEYVDEDSMIRKNIEGLFA